MDEDQKLDLQRYFADPSGAEPVLQPGARGEHCRNVRLALMRLGFDAAFRFEPPAPVFDDHVSAELKKLQAARSHTSVDGLCGPGTRRVLVEALLAEGGAGVFARMADPERRGEGQAFVSYARVDRARLEPLAALARSWGYDVWYDEALSGGERFSETLMGRIEGAYLVLALESAAAAASEWVRREVEHAAEKGVRVLAIELDPGLPAHALTPIFDAHHRLGPAPADVAAPEARPYRLALKHAFAEAHRARRI